MLQWKQEYETGIEDIDYQHHFFFNLIVRLYGELASSDDLLYKNALISELAAYARFHFISEENMMLRSAFPGMHDHKNLHHELLNHLSVRVNKMEINCSDENRWAVIAFLMDWFLHHTTTIDQEFAKYLHNGGWASR